MLSPTSHLTQVNPVELNESISSYLSSMSVNSGLNPTDQLSNALKASGILHENEDEGRGNLHFRQLLQQHKRQQQQQLEQLTRSLSSLTPVPLAQLMATGGEVAGMRELLLTNLARTSAEAAREFLAQHQQNQQKQWFNFDGDSFSTDFGEESPGTASHSWHQAIVSV
jgi:hypothetical protein